jgi:lipoate-protein ligase A
MAPESPLRGEPIFEELRLLEDDVPRSAALQMGLDQALLELSEVPVLRIYRWENPCVTIGYFDSCSAAERAHPGLQVVRRWTGGGSVLHGDDAPYSLIVPQREPFAGVRAANAYKLLHRALAEALRGRFPHVTLAAQSAPKQSASCFENPVSDDLLCGGHKIGGAGQRRTRLGLLHQGSLQLEGARFEEAGLFAQRLATRVVRGSLQHETLLHAQHIAQTRYALASWNEDKRRESGIGPLTPFCPK